MLRSRLAMLALFLIARAATAGPFTTGNLVVLAQGGSDVPTSAATISLREYTTAPGQIGPVQTIVMPNGATGTRLTGVGTTISGLSLSSDNRYLTLAGYDAELGTANVIFTAAQTIGRVARDGSAAYTTTNAFDGAVRGVTTVNGSTYWAVGQAGFDSSRLAAITHGSGEDTTIFGASGAMRDVHIFNNQVYFTQGDLLRRTNFPLPTTGGGGATTLSGVTNLVVPRSFVMLDRDGNDQVDTLYVTNAGGGVSELRKYSSSDGGSNWTPRGVAFNFTGLAGITGVVDGNTADLYVTTGSSLQLFTDTAAINSNISGSFTTLATAEVGIRFDGVAFAPSVGVVPEPGSLLLGAAAAAGGVAALRRRRKRSGPR